MSKIWKSVASPLWPKPGKSGLSTVNSCLISPFFSRAKLQQADFTGAELDGTNICNANLLSCSVTGAGMKGAVFARANPKSACLMDSSFCNADLQSAHL